MENSQMRRVDSDYEVLEKYIQASVHTAVDVGCGTGEMVRWMASQGVDVTGVDLANMIDKARGFKKVKTEKYLTGTGEKLSFKDNYADVITYIASFHHIPSSDMIPALKECERVLKPGGIAILIEPVPKKGSYYEIIKLAEDEAEIQNYTYKFLKNPSEVSLRLVGEEIYYLERSFQDYIKLLNLYMDSKKERNKVIEQAGKITREFCDSSGIDFEEFTYKSIARLMIFKKNKET
jgi:ubiquinone/menaquinone biosynthesis C-methylase UbiE